MTPATQTIQWIEEHLADGVELLHLSDDLSVDTGQRVADRLDALAADGREDLILDLGAVYVLDPLAVLLLVHAARRVRSRGLRVSLVVDPRLLVFDVPGLEEFHTVAMTLEQALSPPSATAA